MITIKTEVSGSPEHIWNCWSNPDHIVGWYFASDDWHAPSAENDLQPGGAFNIRMQARDGSFGFDLKGIHQHIEHLLKIESSLEDGRKVTVTFNRIGNRVEVVESFEPESTNSLELQRQGWQAILNNFKHYAESLN